MQLCSMLRFTFRDVLWLTLVVGLVLGWWVHHRRQDEERRVWIKDYQEQWLAARAAEWRVRELMGLVEPRSKDPSPIDTVP